MNKGIPILFIALFLLLVAKPSISEAHPGNTASDGCHYCRTNCDSWGVPWNQRHCHNSGGYEEEYDAGEQAADDYYKSDAYYQDMYGDASDYAPDPEDVPRSNNVSDTEQSTSKSEGCYIATAAYGTETAEDISVLRKFRDEYLKETEVGKNFIEFYYKNSPPVANTIAKNETLKYIIREFQIKPLVGMLKFTERAWSK